jgi:hypothetical protein
LEKALRVLQAEICRGVEMNKERSEDFKKSCFRTSNGKLEERMLGEEHESTSLAGVYGYTFWPIANRI